MPAAGRYPLPTEPRPLVRQMDAADLSAAAVADGLAEVVTALPPGAGRDAVLAVVRSARPDVLREERKREAARLVERDMAAGYGRQAARVRAARAVGVAPSTVRGWGL